MGYVPLVQWDEDGIFRRSVLSEIVVEYDLELPEGWGGVWKGYYQPSFYLTKLVYPEFRGGNGVFNIARQKSIDGSPDPILVMLDEKRRGIRLPYRVDGFRVIHDNFR